MTTGVPLPRIFCAIDTADQERARTLSTAIAQGGGGLKFGLEFFNAHGPDGIRAMMEHCPDTPVFLDLKFHDIPHTVAGAVRAAAALAPTYINVHAGGGLDMMIAARNAARETADKLNITPPSVLAVTILTSLNEAAIETIGFRAPMADRVRELAQLTQKAGLDGVVCSPHEISLLREQCGDDFVLMVPGIRPADHRRGSDDQKRTMTPEQAMTAGATHLVIGRPITGSDNPTETMRSLLTTIS